MKRFLVFCLLFLSSSVLQSAGAEWYLGPIHRQEKAKDSEYTPEGPYLAGCLFFPGGYTIPKDEYSVQPVLYLYKGSGFYGDDRIIREKEDFDTAFLETFIQLGITDNIELIFITMLQYNYGGRGKDYIGVSDLVVGTSYQDVRDLKNYYDFTWRIGLEQLFPSGTFDGLDPIYRGKDGVGVGVWTTTIYNAASMLFHLYKEQFLAPRACLFLTFFTPTRINGVSVYGGDILTRGKFSSGFATRLELGFEYTLTLHWSLLFDIGNIYLTRNYFSGITRAEVGTPYPGYILSFSPGLAYNFNDSISAIVGYHKSAYERNASGFTQAVASISFSF